MTRRPQWSPADFGREIYESDLPPAARLVAIVLRDEFYRAGRGKISLSQIEQKSGLSRSTVCRHLTTLDEAGYITRKVPTTAGSFAHKAMTHYDLRRFANVSRHDTQGVEPVQVTNVSRHGTSDVSRHETRSVSSRDTPSRNKVGADARSAGAPRATAPRLTIAIADVADEPDGCAIQVWLADEADTDAVHGLLAKKVRQLASTLNDRGHPAMAYVWRASWNNPAVHLCLPTSEAETAQQKIAGWCRAARYDVRFGAPEPPTHDAAPTSTTTKEKA